MTKNPNSIMAYLNWRTPLKLLKETFLQWQKHRASQSAAALAYYTVFSLTPLLVIAIAIAGSIFGENAARHELIAKIQLLIGNSGTDVIKTILDNASQPEIKGLASWISMIVLMIGASGVFAELQDSLNHIWEVDNSNRGGLANLIRKRLLSFLSVLGFGILLVVSLLANVALSVLNKWGKDILPGFDIIWKGFNLLYFFGVLTFLFALLYRYVPDVSLRWKDVIIGAIMTSLLFVLGKELVGIYLSRSSFSSAYGAAGSLIVFLAWIYYSAQILLFGAEFTQVYSKRHGSRFISNR